MRVQQTFDNVITAGRFSTVPGAAACYSVVNDPNLTNVTFEQEQEAAKQLAEFLLEVVPAGVLSTALDIIEEPVSRLIELGDHFDELAFEGLTTRVDPGLNSFFTDKHQQWNGGAYTTAAALKFIRRAVEYAENGHKELSVKECLG